MNDGLSMNATTLATVTAMVVGMWVVIVFIVKMMLKDLQDRNAGLNDKAAMFEDIAVRAVYGEEICLNLLRAIEGKSPLEKVLAVVPEHKSPMTELQRATGVAAGLRARQVVIDKELNIPPRI